MFYIERLTSPQVHTGILPWDFTLETPIPDGVRADKQKRNAWINNPRTKHHVYSFYEGVNANYRVSKANAGGEGNPPRKMWGLVADYDSNEPEDFVIKMAQSLGPPPNWIERTLSGNWRYVWQFEEPARLPSYEFTRHFLKTFHTSGLKVESGMVGFDKAAWLEPSRMFTNSCDWRPLHPTPISKEIVTGWLVQASSTYKWTEDEFGIAIPLEIVKSALEEKYPRFNEWPGEFTLGSQGPSFWVAESTSPKSAIVRETGIQTFSAHAHKAFFTWSDLLGHKFAKEYETVAIGRAVENIYFDGKYYFRQIADESWKPFDKGDLALHLRVERKVSPKQDKTGVSNVDRCIAFVHSHQSVAGCAPFALKPAGLIEVNNSHVLNTSTRKVLLPAEEGGEWGESGRFPWISQLLDVLFNPHEQLDFFLSWLSLFYGSAYRQKPRSGQNIFIAGNTGVGKTLLGTRIIAALVGGFAEAKEYLLGQDKFGSELFEVCLWCVDDATFTADQKTRKHFSEMIKRMAANRTFRYHAKFRIPLMVGWQGRVIVTCNRDEQSILVLPDLEISILDKIMLFKTADETVKFPEPDEIEAILQRELPYFARYLLDYKMPPHCKGDARFGVKSYHEASLVETANQSSIVAGFGEILDDWKTYHFTERKPDAPYWEGSAFQLHKQLMLDQSNVAAMRPYNVNAVNRALAGLKTKGAGIESYDKKGKRIWRIFRPAPEQSAPAPFTAAKA